MKKIFFIVLVSFICLNLFGQTTRTLIKPEKGYRFQIRIKGPDYKKCKIYHILRYNVRSIRQQEV